MLVHSQGVLGLVDDAFAGASVNVLVLASAKLVRGGLSSRLLAIGNNSAEDELAIITSLRIAYYDYLPRDLISGSGNSLLELLGGRLGGIGLEALLGLC